MFKFLTTVRALRHAILEEVAVGRLADGADVDHQRLPAELSRVGDLRSKERHCDRDENDACDGGNHAEKRTDAVLSVTTMFC